MGPSMASTTPDASTFTGFMYYLLYAMTPTAFFPFLNSIPPGLLWFSTALSAIVEQVFEQVSTFRHLVEVIPSLVVLVLMVMVLLRSGRYSVASCFFFPFKTILFFIRLALKSFRFAWRTGREITSRVTLLVMMLCTVVVFLTCCILLSEYSASFLDTLCHRKVLLMPVETADGIIYVLNKASKGPLDHYLDMAGKALPLWAVDYLPESLRPVTMQTVETKMDVYVQMLGNLLYQKWLRGFGMPTAEALMTNANTNVILSFCGASAAVVASVAEKAILYAQPYLAPFEKYVGPTQKVFEIAHSHLPVVQDFLAGTWVIAEVVFAITRDWIVVLAPRFYKFSIFARDYLPVHEHLVKLFVVGRTNLLIVWKFIESARTHLTVANDHAVATMAYLQEGFSVVLGYLPVVQAAAQKFLDTSRKYLVIVRDQSSVAQARINGFSAQTWEFSRLRLDQVRWLLVLLVENRRPVLFAAFFVVCILASTIGLLRLLYFVVFYEREPEDDADEVLELAPAPAGQGALGWISSAYWFVCRCGRALRDAVTTIPTKIISLGRRIKFILDAVVLLFLLARQIYLTPAAKDSRATGSARTRIINSYRRAMETTTEEFLAAKLAKNAQNTEVNTGTGSSKGDATRARELGSEADISQGTSMTSEVAPAAAAKIAVAKPASALPSSEKQRRKAKKNASKSKKSATS